MVMVRHQAKSDDLDAMLVRLSRKDLQKNLAIPAGVEYVDLMISPLHHVHCYAGHDHSRNSSHLRNSALPGS